MRKHFFFFTLLLCLCTNSAWGIDWVGETPTAASCTTSFYIKSKISNLYINGSSLSSTPLLWTVAYKTGTSSDYTVLIYCQQNNKQYNLNIGKSRTIQFKNETGNDVHVSPSATNTSINAWKIWRNASSDPSRMYNNNGSLAAESATQNAVNTGATETSDWLFIGETQYANHIALDEYFEICEAITSSSYPDAYKTANGYSLLPLNNYADYSTWLCSVDNSTAINDNVETLNDWYTAAEAVRVAYANALDCAAKISDAGYTVSTPSFNYDNVTDINTALATYRSAALASLMSTTFVSKKITFMLDNPDFEFSPSDEYWDYGWTGTTDELKDGADNQMNYFQKNTVDDNTYAWMYQEGRTMFNQKDLKTGDIYQQISLPAGCYRVSVDLLVDYKKYDEKYATFYVKDYADANITSINVNQITSFTTKSLYFTLESATTVKIGVSHPSGGNKQQNRTVAVDNFQLFIKNEIVNGDLTNASSGTNNFAWNMTTDNGSWNYLSGGFEVYEGDNSSGRKSSYSMKQDVYLRAGFYKLTGNAFFRKNDKTLDDGRTSEAKLCAGSDKVSVLPLRRSQSESSSPEIDSHSAAVTALSGNSSNYTNELYFQVASDASVSIGYEGDFNDNGNYKSWFVAGPVSLTRLGDSYSQSVTVSSAGWATICLPYKADIPDGVTAYYVSEIRDNGDGTKSIVVTETSGTVAAYEPLIINASAGSYTFEWSEEDASAIGSSNKLSGTYAPMEFENSEVFVLGYDSEEGAVFFGPLKDGGETYDILPANKAYLDATLIGDFTDPSSAPSRISFIIESENNTTGTEKVSDEIKVKKIFRNGQVLIMRGNEMFDVMGRRVF